MMFDFLTKIRGPSFKDADRVEIDLSGNKVSFIAPGYNYRMIEQDQQSAKKHRFDLNDPSIYWSSTEVREDDRLFDSTKEADGFAIFKSIWSFSKPLIDVGEKEPKTKDDGSIDLIVRVYQFDNIDSLFIPQNLEQAILFDISTSYGPESYFGGPGSGGRKYTAPCNWSPKNFGNNSWAYYFVSWMGHPRSGEHIWVTPLSKKHYLSFCFNDPGNPSSRLFQAYQDLMTKIVSSCTINYSNEIKAQITEVAEEAANSKISERVEPFAWEEYDLYPEKFEVPMSDD